MKIKFMICAVFIFCTVSATIATPVMELVTKAGTITNLNVLQPVDPNHYGNSWLKTEMISFDPKNIKSRFNDLPFIAKLRSNSMEIPTFSTVREPATMLLFGCGLVGLSIITRRKINK